MCCHRAKSHRMMMAKDPTREIVVERLGALQQRAAELLALDEGVKAPVNTGQVSWAARSVAGRASPMPLQRFLVPFPVRVLLFFAWQFSASQKSSQAHQQSRMRLQQCSKTFCKDILALTRLNLMADSLPSDIQWGSTSMKIQRLSHKAIG